MNIPPRPCDDYCEYPSDRGMMAEDRWAFEDRFREAPVVSKVTPKRSKPFTGNESPPEEPESGSPSVEVCYECGHSVAWGSGRFVNRIPADMPEGQEEWSKAPHGEWICAECLEGGAR